MIYGRSFWLTHCEHVADLVFVICHIFHEMMMMQFCPYCGAESIRTHSVIDVSNILEADWTEKMPTKIELG